jgi:deoxyribodipyrimidine photo-lyase
MILPTLQELGLEFSEIDSRAIQFKGDGSNAAIKSLFFETKNLSVYKETRNGMGEAYSSKFRFSYGLYFT